MALAVGLTDHFTHSLTTNESPLKGLPYSTHYGQIKKPRAPGPGYLDLCLSFTCQYEKVCDSFNCLIYTKEVCGACKSVCKQDAI